MRNIIREFIDRLKPHYEIIGYYTGKPIGCTVGKKDWTNIIAEEPGAAFRRCKRKNCHICGKEDADGTEKD